MGIFDCFRDERTKEINRLVEKKRYASLLHQCGYDEISPFTQLWTILSGPQEQYGQLAQLIAQDQSGIVGELINPYIPERQTLPEKARKELFSIGVNDQAQKIGEYKLTRELGTKGFSDEKVVKEILSLRTEEIMAKGLESIAGSMSNNELSSFRASYIDRKTKELDRLIEATQSEALGELKNQISAAENYVELLAQKRDELKKPYEDRKPLLEKEFESDVATVGEQIKARRLGKAYDLATAIGYASDEYIMRGIYIVKQNRAPAWLFEEIIKNARINNTSCAPQAFYRTFDQQLAVLVTANGKTYLRQEPVQHQLLKDKLGSIIADINCFGNRNPDVYVEIDETKRRPQAIVKLLVEEALTRTHREQ